MFCLHGVLANDGVRMGSWRGSIGIIGGSWLSIRSRSEVLGDSIVFFGRYNVSPGLREGANPGVGCTLRFSGQIEPRLA